ncbi:kinase-like domain-containing protein [Suillus clintonianus]|uniref:kinase-like domain-containing protein n=1 Tax=Suillus clintonianus TaxID=1904413 RepID=UPI001B86648D|nr:kinase-like domain-containing protein [Suillus clintonianus]KAG2139327.1 kinase-like domain-containing protein [Suillus clintonianus]
MDVIFLIELKGWIYAFKDNQKVVKCEATGSHDDVDGNINDLEAKPLIISKGKKRARDTDDTKATHKRLKESGSLHGDSDITASSSSSTGIIEPPSYLSTSAAGSFDITALSSSSTSVIESLSHSSASAAAIRRLERFPNASGWLGNVWKCSMSTQSEARPVAVKSVRIPPGADGESVQKTGNRIRREGYIWIQLSHGNILPLEGVTEGFGPLPAFVAPWMENGTLNDYLRREVGLSREKKLTMVCVSYLRRQAESLFERPVFMHDKDIVHGDMTDTNILVSGDGRLYLADFSLSMILAESDNTTFSSFHGGNSRWMPPEAIVLLEGMEQPESKPTKAGDVYAYGCIMMRVFSGHQPYHHVKGGAIAIMGAVLRGVEPFPQLTDIDEGIQRFARQCLLRNSEHRPLIAQIVEFLWSQTNITETTISGSVTAMRIAWTSSVAVKTLREDVNSQNDMEKICNRIRREMFVRKGLRRDTILTLYGMTTGFGVLPSFVYPWMAGGSLHDYLQREYSNLSTHRKLNILLEVADGIKYLHKKDIAHGNLTGDNVLLDGSGHIRITNFSHSMILAEASSLIFSEQLLGDARYIAPEFIVRTGRTGAPKPTKAGDVYSYGCVTILYSPGVVRKGAVLVDFRRESGAFGESKGHRAFSFNLGGMIFANFILRTQQTLNAKIGKVHLNLFEFSVQRSDQDYHDAGGFAYVHKCKLSRRNIFASVQQVDSRRQLSSMTTSVDVAVKAIMLRNDVDILKIINRLFREIKLWLKLKHKNIVPLWGVADGFGSLPALVSPWLENGALTGYIQRQHKMLSYNRKFALLEDIAQGLQYLHSQSIVHGDLSGNNVLVDENETASLTDFGLSAFLPDRTSEALLPTNPSCTMPYMAPEYLTTDDKINLSPKSDVYSFRGIMLEARGYILYYPLNRLISFCRFWRAKSHTITSATKRP